MKKIELNKFQDFIDSNYLKEGVQTNPGYWNKYFNNLPAAKQEVLSTSQTSISSSLPNWAKKELDQDRLKGKSAEQRWQWLTGWIKSSIKDKQATKVEEINSSELGGMSGYRILWKEGNTEAPPKQKDGKEVKVYFTEMFKGEPGIYVDKENVNGTPGKELEKGYWGQKSKVPVGSTGASLDPGILWMSPPEGQGSESEYTLLDLFATTELGEKVLDLLRSTPQFKKFQETGEAEEIKFTEDPITDKEIKSSLSSSQKQEQKANSKKLEETGQKVEEPEYSKITSGEYSYNPDVFEITWDQMFNALKKSGADKSMDFRKSNIIGVRNTLYTKNKFSNRFTDLIVFMGPKRDKEIKVYPGTTTPGPVYMYTPYRNWWTSVGLQETLNPAGVAILQPGVYEYKVGKYKDKYDALIQNGEVMVGRITPVASLKEATFKTFSPTPIERVKRGIDIIKAETNTPSIDAFSAGSQVFKKSEDFKDMMKRVESSGQSRINYALIDSSNLKKE